MSFHKKAPPFFQRSSYNKLLLQSRWRCHVGRHGALLILERSKRGLSVRCSYIQYTDREEQRHC